jgi:5-formyltetrahydrofolate cyclo-ligase
MSPADDSIRAAKAALRKQVLARRDALSPEIRVELSARITARLLELDSFRAAKCVLAYMSIGSEFDTRALVGHVLAQGKTLLLPRVVRGSRTLALHAVKDLAQDLQAGVWGIAEPNSKCQEISQPFDFEWVLVPGLAFTPMGDRLGYGAGYYDRLIASCTHKPALIAAAFALQVVDAVPCTASDQDVDCVVTEDAIYTR